MKKFKFRLEPLLKMKAHTEKERQKDHAQATEKVLSQKRELHRLGQTQTSTADRLREEMTDKLSVAELLVYSRYLLKLKKDTVTGNEMLRVLERNVEAKRQALVEATKQRKIYDKLREYQQDKHRKRADQLETKDLDELAITSFRRKHKK